MKPSVALAAAAIAGTVVAVVVGLNQHDADEAVVTVEHCRPGEALTCDAFDSSGPKGARYKRVEVTAQECETRSELPDGGNSKFVSSRMRPDSPKPGLELLEVSCRLSSTETQGRKQVGGVTYLPHVCACRGESGQCLYTNSSGVQLPAPFGRTLGPGYPPYESFSGAGCVLKACSEVAGETSWPAACPKG